MNFANTKQLLTLWIGAFIGAFFLHVLLGAQFYFQSTGVSNGSLSSEIMLTFAQEAVGLDVDKDLSDINTEPEVLQSDLLEQESERLETVDELQPEEVQPEEVQPEEVQPEEVQPEEVQHTVEKDNFKSLEELLPQKVEHKAFIKKTIPMPKAVVRRSNAKAIRSSSSSKGGDTAALEDALLVEWLAKVQAQLERQKKYVVGQRTSRAKGTVKLEFMVHEQGSIFSSRIVVSAGDPELDRLAMAALQRVGNFPPPPASKANKIIRVSLIFS
ncbi:energy transducer TonB [Bartonella jaculi]|uniref:TonB C-terminal domain-containing protein n=1 Tax=Bartonella jaculi TaxID=686226 RepID=A0ABP9MZC2_9HYPH